MSENKVSESVSDEEQNTEVSESTPDGYKSIKRKIQKEIRKFFQRKKQYTDLSKDSAAPDDLTSKQYEELSETDRATYSKTYVKLPPTEHTRGEEISTISVQQPRREYDFSHARRGFAVLIIYTEFHNQPKRDSAAYDHDNMREIFEALEFQVIDIINAESKELLLKLKNIRDSIQKNSTTGEDCFACVISSHGAEVRKPSSAIREHLIYTKDGTVTTEEILQIFNNRNCRALRGKPKLFFIQACRGILPEEPGRQEIDHGAPVYVTEDPGEERAKQYQEQTAKDAPATTKETVSSGTESMPDTRQNYRDYKAIQRPTVYEQCNTALEEIDTITKRIQQTTLATTGQNHQQSNVQPDYYQQRWDTQKTAQHTNASRQGVDYLKNVHNTQHAQYGAGVKCGNTANIRFADEEEFYDNVPGTYTQTRVQNPVYQKKISPPVFEPLDFCSVPVYIDYLVMFSAASGTVAWSDGDKGGWLLYCLYHVAKALRKAFFRADLLEILTDTAGKMAREIQANSFDPRYHGAKAAAVIYHRLRKEVYLTPKQQRCDEGTEV